MNESDVKNYLKFKYCKKVQEFASTSDGHIDKTLNFNLKSR